MPELSVNAVVICDDIRKEVTNKDILIGVYGGALVVQSFPAVISVAVWLELTPSSIGSHEIDIRLKSSVLSSDDPVNLPPGVPREFGLRMMLEVSELNEPVTIGTPQATLLFSTPGTLEVWIKWDQEEDWRLVKTKRVFSAPLQQAKPTEIHYEPPPGSRPFG